MNGLRHKVVPTKEKVVHLCDPCFRRAGRADGRNTEKLAICYVCRKVACLCALTIDDFVDDNKLKWRCHSCPSETGE